MRGANPLIALITLLISIPVTGCDGDHRDTAGTQTATGTPPLQVDPGAADSTAVQRAVAVLHPTKGNDVSGVVTFEQQGKGLRVKAEVRNLEPGPHGYHVHLLGDCRAADGTSAGTHFNFSGPSRKPPEGIDRITGDLGNLDAGESGTASAEAMIDSASLQGPMSVIGRAVIVHAKGNDPSQPPIGAAGARVACGVIGIAG